MFWGKEDTKEVCSIHERGIHQEAPVIFKCSTIYWIYFMQDIIVGMYFLDGRVCVCVCVCVCDHVSGKKYENTEDTNTSVGISVRM